MNEAAHQPPDPPAGAGGSVLHLPLARHHFGRRVALVAVAAILATVASFVADPWRAGGALGLTVGAVGLLGVLTMLAGERERRRRLAELKARSRRRP